jgi:pSer/pThr/pTyr-binding forkhead associated (FHA) protein
METANNMGALATKPSSSIEFEIKITAGPEKGAKYLLSGSPILIGRGKDNHISLSNDPKISRQHAKIVFSNNGIELMDISGRKRMIVNGQPCAKALLINNAKIQIGDSVLVFQISQNQNLPEVKKTAGSPQQQFQPQHLGSNQPHVATPKQPKQGHNNFQKKLIIYGVIALILYLVFSDSQNSKKKKNELQTEKAIEQEINRNKELQKVLIKEKQTAGINTPQYREAQASYVRGFRDFRNANYASAMVSFQACLTLFEDHKLCKRYYTLSFRKHTELIQYNMALAQQYQEQGQFKKCAHRYKRSMTLSSKLSQEEYRRLYRQAKSAAKNCLLLIKDNY